MLQVWLPVTVLTVLGPCPTGTKELAAGAGREHCANITSCEVGGTDWSGSVLPALVPNPPEAVPVTSPCPPRFLMGPAIKCSPRLPQRL